ncbi:retrovirus-related pol polyprotein from transposon TNT 1-94, partial [Tanacetum coccineum]
MLNKDNYVPWSSRLLRYAKCGVQNLGIQNMGNQNGLIVVPKIANQNLNLNRNGNVVAARAEGNAIVNNVNQITCYNCRGLGHLARNCTVRPRKRDAAFLQTQIEEVNANCILLANLQQASTSGTQIDKASAYDSDGSAENDSNVISAVSSVEQSWGTVKQNPATVEETRAYFESLYNNLAIDVEKVNTVNHKMKETNDNLTIELARYKNQEKYFEINQEKYDKIERCYQKSVYQEQCLTKKINALHLSSTKTITTFNEKIANLNNQLSKEKLTVSSLQEEKKRLKSNFEILLFEKHDPPAVYDSEETLQLAQESRLKMKQLNKEIKPANYTKINQLTGVFVSQKAKSREELYFSNPSKTANVSKSISIPNEEFSDDTSPSVAGKFLNE